jgi:hypothetical protein
LNHPNPKFDSAFENEIPRWNGLPEACQMDAPNRTVVNCNAPAFAVLQTAA